MTSSSAPVASDSARPAAREGLRALAALCAGLTLGLVAFRWPGRWTALIDVIEPLGMLWLAALQMLALPLMAALLTVTLGRAGGKHAGRLGVLALMWFVGLLAAAAIVTVWLGQLALHWFPVGVDAQSAFRAAAATMPATDATAAPASLSNWVGGLVPSNLVRAAANGDYLALIVATLLFGSALHLVAPSSRDIVLAGAQAIADWCFALAGLLFRGLPAAVFVLTLVSTARGGASIATGLAYYVAWVSAFVLVGLLALYPLAARCGHITISRFARAIWPAQLLAGSTRSSVACLPTMLQTARGPLGVPDHVANFTLPFAVSAFKLNVGISANYQLLFLLHLYGIEPSGTALAVAVLALTLQSFATPGLPSGSVWTTTPVYLALGIPIEGIVLTNVVDTIPDVFKTATNVTADLSLATILAGATSSEHPRS